MAFQLTLSNALLSLRGRVHINDGQGQLRYEARGEFALLSPTWRLFQGDTVVASLRRRIFSWRPHYDVQVDGQQFCIVGKFFSFRRHYTVQGGRWDGATLTGNLFDMRFAIEHDGRKLADAQGRWLTLRDVHQVQVHSDEVSDERFVALCLVVVMRQKADQNNMRD